METLISTWHTSHNPQKRHLGWALPSLHKKVCLLTCYDIRTRKWESSNLNSGSWVQNPPRVYVKLPPFFVSGHSNTSAWRQLFPAFSSSANLLLVPRRCSGAFPPSSMDRGWFGNLYQATTVWLWDPVSLLEKIEQFGESNKGHICVFCFMELKISGKLIQWES